MFSRYVLRFLSFNHVPCKDSKIKHPIETNIDVSQVLQFLLGSKELGLSVSSLNPANITVS